MLGTSRRRSDKSVMSDLSELCDDDDDDENINATDHYDDKGLHSVRSETTFPTSNMTQFIGLDLSKSLSKKNDESDSHLTTTMSIKSKLTSSDCCSTTSSNGLIVGFSDQRTNYDDNGLLVGFVIRCRSER